jgi:WD40 repeat protein
VIHVPTIEEAAVTLYHASFPDFVTDPTRCSRKRDPPFYALVASEGHEMLALKCLEQMNRSLKYNIFEVPKELTVSRRGATNSLDNRRKISEALEYSCLYWASHFFETQLSGVDLIDALDTFLHKHLLHWMECLSELGELQTGIPQDMMVWIWNVMTGEVEVELKGHMKWVTSVAFSQDGSHVVSGSYDETVWIWNSTTGEVEVELPVKGHMGSVMCVLLSLMMVAELPLDHMMRQSESGM